jgi:1-acyl-sn-glycerol-3-phosphate acyltransferase
MASLEPIAIDRAAKSTAIKQVLHEGAARLRAGRWLILFPEGTRVAPGTRGRYGGSGGLLAKRSGYSVIPVAHNAGEFWPRHGFLKRPGTIILRIGSPINPSGLSAAEINEQVESWIETQMVELSSRARLATTSAEPAR